MVKRAANRTSIHALEGSPKGQAVFPVRFILLRRQGCLAARSNTRLGFLRAH